MKLSSIATTISQRKTGALRVCLAILYAIGFSALGSRPRRHTCRMTPPSTKNTASAMHAHLNNKRTAAPSPMALSASKRSVNNIAISSHINHAFHAQTYQCHPWYEAIIRSMMRSTPTSRQYLFLRAKYARASSAGIANRRFRCSLLCSLTTLPKYSRPPRKAVQIMKTSVLAKTSSASELGPNTSVSSILQN